jgi:hypothetical protein
LSRKRGAAAAIDDTVSHHARAGDMVRADQRLAAMAFLIYDAAASGLEIVVAWVAGTKQHGA